MSVDYYIRLERGRGPRPSRQMKWIVFYTAAPGTQAREALRLLKVVGTQDLTPRDPS